MTGRRRWIVTGASSGIGRAIARDAPEEGDAVVIVARRRPALESLRDEMVRRDLEVAVVDGDIREQETIERAAEAAE
ncbi:MAG: SDR family NAD(P)-dependent oxidoreductase, partial [Nitriliruptor sp.]